MQNMFFQSGTSSLLCLPSPSIFAYCKQSKTGQWEGRNDNQKLDSGKAGMRLGSHTTAGIAYEMLS